MVDLAAALALARKNANTSKSGGNTGNSGNTTKEVSPYNGLAQSPAVPSNASEVGTLGTVPTVPTRISILGTGRDNDNIQPHQQFSEPVPTVPTVPSQNNDVREKISEPIDPSRCHVCGERFSSDAAVIAVLTDRPGLHLWLHHACHDEHALRCATARAASAIPN